METGPILNYAKLIKESETLNENQNELREILQKIDSLSSFSSKLRLLLPAEYL